MIISDKYKCIFIRVPKTGSTSFEKMWLKFDPSCEISNGNPPYGHYKASKLREMIGEKKWKEYFKCAFIRNPLGWFKSQYCDNLQYNHKDSPPRIHTLLNDEYKLNDPKNKIIDIKDCVFCWVILKEWFKGGSQLEYIDEEMDFIGDFENFNRDVKYIYSNLNIDNIPKQILHATARVMAFILAALATQFIIDGIKASFNI